MKEFIISLLSVTLGVLIYSAILLAGMKLIIGVIVFLIAAAMI